MNTEFLDSRKIKMEKMRFEGQSYQLIGNYFGVSRQRIHQILGSDNKHHSEYYRFLHNPEWLEKTKHLTNDLEKKFLHPNTDRRRVNLDPGYVSAAKLVLASTKDHIHRIYLKDGIYAETTLRMEKKTFRPWQWTYPDYRTEKYIEIFNEIRRIYMEQLRSGGISAHPI